MIKILTGWSRAGGSTTAFINLTNKFNSIGIDCVMYGMHDWHLNKCRSDKAQNLTITNEDRLIIHFFNTNWSQRPPIKKLIYSCHEKDVMPMNRVNYKIFDKIHYVSKPQMEWHNVDHPYFILPNIVEDLKTSTNKPQQIAGIIGSVDRNKQTHVSINRALNDSMSKIILFGKVTDVQYYTEEVEPLLRLHSIDTPIYEEDKQKMYDMVSDVYLSSLSETWSYIKKECDLTGTKFHGTNMIEKNFELEMTNDEIIESWKKELSI